MRLAVGIPDPSARTERVGPTGRDWVVGNGSVSDWVSVPAPGDPSDWIYIRLEGSIASASYRCDPESRQPTPWKPLRSPAEAFATTGYEPEDDEAEEPGADPGAAERLLPGIYMPDFPCQLDGEERCLRGIRFDVPPADRARPGTVLAVDPEKPGMPWWRSW